MRGERARAHLIATLLASLSLLAYAPTTRSAEVTAPAGLVPDGYLGQGGPGVIGVEGCTERGDQRCLLRQARPTPGELGYPIGVVASAARGVYVTEGLDQRVQRRDPKGRFSVLGWDVNVSATKRGLGQAQRDVCAPAEGELCGAGKPGAAPGQLEGPESVAVDPASGDVFVLEIANHADRIDKLAESGGFLWRVGGNVKPGAGGNLCTEEQVKRSHVDCGPGEPSAVNRDEPGAFKFASQSGGNLLAFDERRQLLYVGDEHRVQVFDANGRWRDEIPLVSVSGEAQSGVAVLALAPSGHLDVVYRVGPVENFRPTEQGDVIHELGADGRQAKKLTILPSFPGAIVSIDAMAVGPNGQIATMGLEIGAPIPRRFAFVYWPAQHETIEFTPPADNDGIAFDSSGNLYVATAVDRRVEIYKPAESAGALSSPPACTGGALVALALPGGCPRVTDNVRETE